MARETITALMTQAGNTIEVREDGFTRIFDVLEATLQGTKVCLAVRDETGSTRSILLGASQCVIRR